MYLFYIDDSNEAGLYGFCALGVPAGAWLESFSAVKSWRAELKQSDGIFLRKELHATEFCAGRGRISSDTVPKGRRCQIFRDTLVLLSTMDHLLLFSSILRRQEWAFERLINRINRTMLARDTQAILISDEGRENDYTRLCRRLSVHNPIPSQYGVWRGTGKTTRNIPTDRIIEDPIFRPSHRSYFVQMADFCAYALIRYELGVSEKKKQYGLHTAFPLLGPICVREANRKHPFGIIGK